MKISRLFFTICLLGGVLLLPACEMSMRNDPRYAPFIGKKYKTKEKLFLVESTNCYVFYGERTSFSRRDYTPTFEEFSNGYWVNHRHGQDYRFIIPAGSEVQLVDIIYEYNPEAGESVSWYGIFVSPPEGMDLDKKIILNSYWADYKDPAPSVPPFIHKEGYDSLFVPVD